MKNDEAIVEIDDLQLNELKIVGIGASAGGLSAFETLFTALSDNVFFEYGIYIGSTFVSRPQEHFGRYCAGLFFYDCL